MSPCPDDNAIAGLLQGALSAEEVRSIESHLDECAECSRLVAELARLGGSPEPPEHAAGRYRMQEPIGAGGMGLVYVAYDTELKRKVAVKRLRPRDGGAGPREHERARFLREAQVLASLSHPNVLAVHDLATIEGERFIVMELIDGSPVSRWVREQRPGWREILDVYRQAGRGLAAAHAADIVHRDVKPANILVSRDGRALVTDFGLAGLTDAERGAPAAGGREDAARGGEKVTQPGEILGTPAYMAPEQQATGMADARSDQYSFCAALRESLNVGRTGAGAPARVPRWLDRVVAVGLNVDPAKRYPSMRELLAALDRAQSRAVLGRRLAVAAVVLVGASTMAVGAAVHLRGRTVAGPPTAPPPAPVPASPAVAPPTPPVAAPSPPPPPTAEKTRSGQRGGGAPKPPPAVSGLFVPAAGPRHLLETGVLAAAPPTDPVKAQQARDTARRAALRRDGGACLAALETAGPLRDDGTTELRARCEMLAGRCDEGQRRLRELYAGRPGYQSRLEDAVRGQAYLYCPPRAFAAQPERVEAIVQRGLHAREEHRPDGCWESASMLAREVAAGRGTPAFCAALEREQERSGRRTLTACSTRVPALLSSMSECLLAADRCEDATAVSRFADHASGAPPEAQARLAHERAERIRRRCSGRDALAAAEEKRTVPALTLVRR